MTKVCSDEQFHRAAEAEYYLAQPKSSLVAAGESGLAETADRGPEYEYRHCKPAIAAVTESVANAYRSEPPFGASSPRSGCGLGTLLAQSDA